MKTGIEVKTGFFLLAFILFMCTPVIEINGEKNRRPWGNHFFDLAPGDYVVKIYFPYLFMSECGANQLKVSVAEGNVKKISYRAPLILLMAGKIKEVSSLDF